MAILEKLSDEKLKLSQISTKLDLPVQEVSRQLSRLSKQGLVEKTPEGSYTISNYTDQILKFVPSIKFLVKNSKYIKSHDLNRIPYEFIMRIGELDSSTYEKDTIRLIDRAYNLLEQAEEYIWALTTQPLPNIVSIIDNKVRKEVDVRVIYPSDIVISTSISPYVQFLDEIDVRFIVTDMEAMVGFNDLLGQPHYTGFFSKDPTFRKWCIDLHQHYWQKSTNEYLDHERE